VEYELPAIPYKRGANARNSERIVRHNIFGWIPKVDSNNCIIIHPIKDSWNREEVEKLCEKAFSCGVRLWEDWEKEDVEMWEKFKKENL